MLTLGSKLSVPEFVLFTTVDQDVVLLNTQTNRYYSLDEVGAQFWRIVTGGRTVQEAYGILLEEYDVAPDHLEQDILDLLKDLKENNLVEIVPE